MDMTLQCGRQAQLRPALARRGGLNAGPFADDDQLRLVDQHALDGHPWSWQASGSVDIDGAAQPQSVVEQGVVANGVERALAHLDKDLDKRLAGIAAFQRVDA